MRFCNLVVCSDLCKNSKIAILLILDYISVFHKHLKALRVEGETFQPCIEEIAHARWRAFRSGRLGRAAPGARGVKVDGELLVLNDQVVE